MDNLSSSEKIVKGLNTFFEGVRETITDFVISFVNAVSNITNDFLYFSSDKYIVDKASTSTNQEIKKYLNIYYRTNKKRIKKKQITKMRKNLM